MRDLEQPSLQLTGIEQVNNTAYPASLAMIPDISFPSGLAPGEEVQVSHIELQAMERAQIESAEAFQAYDTFEIYASSQRRRLRWTLRRPAFRKTGGG